MAVAVARREMAPPQLCIHGGSRPARQDAAAAQSLVDRPWPSQTRPQPDGVRRRAPAVRSYRRGTAASAVRVGLRQLAAPARASSCELAAGEHRLQQVLRLHACGFGEP